MSPRVSVIVTTWNAADVLGACLDSVAAQQLAGGFETIVVDDASSDRTEDVLRRRADGIRVVAHEANVGWSASNNRGAQHARGEVLVFLNADTELRSPDTLERLVAAAEEPDVGLAGPMLLNPDGSLQPSCASHPTVAWALLTSTGLRRLLPAAARARLAPEIGPQDQPADVDWLMGAALAIRADVFRALGGFWPALYGEEQDLAYRVQRRGLRVRYEASARITHIGNHSLGQRQSNAARAARVARAELRFLRAHYRRPRAVTIRAIVGAGYALRVLLHTAAGNRGRAAEYRAMARVYGGRGGD